MKVHIKVIKEDGQSTIGKLRKLALLDEGYEILRERDYLLIPVIEGADVTPLENAETVELKGRVRCSKPAPEGIKGSYDTIGSIVIMKKSSTRDPLNLANNLLRRNGIKSVYLDSGVSGPFRTRKLSLIAGEENKVTLYRENGVDLKVDVENAYFSPRLATERMLVSEQVKDGDLVIDMFAGIGPFSVLIAKNHDCRVISIDHNPRAIELLRENVSMNKMEGRIEPVLGDAEEIIAEYSGVDRVIMNLPHGAAPFLEAAIKVLKIGGVINFYEVSTVEGITERMIELKKLGLLLVAKREVHGYSKLEYMYSLELKKERVQTT